jgi:hypothetical protein
MTQRGTRLYARANHGERGVGIVRILPLWLVRQMNVRFDFSDYIVKKHPSTPVVENTPGKAALQGLPLVLGC